MVLGLAEETLAGRPSSLRLGRHDLVSDQISVLDRVLVDGRQLLIGGGGLLSRVEQERPTL